MSSCWNGRQGPIIEVIGLCGAGKTTFFMEIVERFQNQGRLRLPPGVRPIPVSGYFVVCWSAWLAFSILCKKPASAVRFLARARNWHLVMKIAYRWLGLLKRNMRDGAFLVDSGVLQPIISFQVEENTSLDPVPLKEILASIPLPDIFIFINVPPPVAMERYMQREIAHNRPIKGTDVTFRNADSTLAELVELGKEQKVRVLVVDFHHDLHSGNREEAIEDIARQLSEELAHETH